MNAIALSDATAGSRYCICEIKEENRLVNRLSSMGLLCGSTIEMCQNHEKQPVLIYARDTLVAIGREESKKNYGGRCRQMSNCENCSSNQNCKYHGSSQLYKKDGNTPVITLLGQPNSGKSTIFNMTTGSHQHVGNWPGKTVDQKEGECKWNGKRLIIADLPGSYSLSAGSDEEVITRDYISAGNADLVVVMADASQLKLSLYMLADFVGMKVPAILVLNMIDVAKGQGIVIDTAALSEKLGVPVVTMSAIRKKDYRVLYENIETALTEKPIIVGEPMTTAKEKMAYIDDLLNGVITVAALTPLSGILRSGMKAISVHPLLISLICDVLINVLYFALMMASFVLSITLGFNLMEETDYLARISFLFDNTMSKVGLQGKTIMPFFMGLGCTIAGTTGTRVVDNWGQRVLAIAMSWAVPCAATLSVVPTIAIALFGSTGGFLVMMSIFLFMFLMMWVVYKVFGNSLAPKEELVGLIMELPPYHKPAIKNTLYVTFQRTLGIFLRALRIISLVSIVFFVLTYGFGGNAENSILYKLGVLIEPLTKFFGMKWEAFLAFCASAISKESLLGVLNTLYGAGGSLVSSTFGAKVSWTAASISDILSANFTKAEGLAFIFAISFNMPCISALAATARETHSAKWTAKIGVFYTLAALLIACVVYHIGVLKF